MYCISLSLSLSISSLQLIFKWQHNEQRYIKRTMGNKRRSGKENKNLCMRRRRKTSRLERSSPSTVYCIPEQHCDSHWANSAGNGGDGRSNLCTRSVVNITHKSVAQLFDKCEMRSNVVRYRKANVNLKIRESETLPSWWHHQRC